MELMQQQQISRKQRIDLLKRFCESNIDEITKKVLAKFRLVSGVSLQKSEEYLEELILSETIIVSDNRIKEVH